MYRGSAPISHKDYTIHFGAVRLIKQFYFLRCDEQHEISLNHLPELLNLCKALKNHYSSFDYTIKGEISKKKPTDTLISKIIIGTLGCSPAFDRYFNIGAKDKGYQFRSISEKNFINLFLFKDKFESDLLDIQKQLLIMD